MSTKNESSKSSGKSKEQNEVNNATAEVTPMTNAEIKKLAGPCITKLNSLHSQNIEGALEIGKIAHEFKMTVTKNETVWVNAFKILEEYPGSLLHQRQLRDYEGAFLLHEAMKQEGKTADVSFSHYVVVLGSKKNLDSKVAYLKKAETNKWSVAKLKKQIAAEKENGDNNDNGKNGKKPNETLPDVWDRSIKKLKTSIEDCLGDMSAVNNIKGKKTIPSEIQEYVFNLIEFATSNGFATTKQTAQRKAA